MVSILIPNYNYNVYGLVNSLVKQCNDQIDFEVIVFDDASTKLYFENNEINALKNCTYKILAENIGRSAIRNLLVKSAKYEWILFLDSDVLPLSTNFIANYVDAISQMDAEVFFGGLAYENQKPVKENQLRWFYGWQREALSLKSRETNKPNDFFCSNLFLKKTVFNNVSFASEIKKYGYEDLIFNLNVIDQNFKIKQIYNPVYHLNIESNLIFLNKTQLALQNLKILIDNKKLCESDIKIVKYANFLKKGRFIKSILRFIKIDILLKKIILFFPSNIFLFDLYKLLYYIRL